MKTILVRDVHSMEEILEFCHKHRDSKYCIFPYPVRTDYDDEIDIARIEFPNPYHPSNGLQDATKKEMVDYLKVLLKFL